MRGPGRVVTDRDTRGFVEESILKDCLSPYNINPIRRQQVASELWPSEHEMVARAIVSLPSWCIGDRTDMCIRYQELGRRALICLIDPLPGRRDFVPDVRDSRCAQRCSSSIRTDGHGRESMYDSVRAQLAPRLPS